MNTEEKLAAAEIRALAAETRMFAAEMALFDEITRAQNVLDIGKNHAAGLIPTPERICLAAIASATPDLTAARELVEKAKRLDEIESCARELYEVFKETYQDQDSDPLRVYCLALASGLASSWLVGKIENGYTVGLDHTAEGPITVEFRKENGKTLIESNLALRAERDALAVHVDRMRQCANRIHDIQCSKEVQAVYSLALLHGQPYSGQTWEKEMHELRNSTPAASLAAYREGVLEEVAKRAEIRGLNEPGYLTPAEIRAMKGGTR